MLNEARLRSHDWRNTILDGTRAAEQAARSGVIVDGSHIAWELLKEAVAISRIAYSAPPRVGFPAKSAFPDSVDEVTVWQPHDLFTLLKVAQRDGARSVVADPVSVQEARAALRRTHLARFIIISICLASGGLL